MTKKTHSDATEPSSTAGEPVPAPPHDAPVVPEIEGSPKKQPHLDDLLPRDFKVHLTNKVRAGQDVVILRTPHDGYPHTFHRAHGDTKALLTRTVEMTPPVARQIADEGWSVEEAS